MVARGWGREKGSCCLMGTEFQFSKVKRVLEMDGGDGRTAVRVYLISLKSTLKMIKTVNVMFCVFYHNKKIEKKQQ